MIEKWKEIKGYDGRYQVSNKGGVKRAKSIGLDHAKIQVLKQSPDKDGYMKLNLSNRLVEKRYLVHRLVLQTFVGSPPKGRYEVNHRNGIKNDNRVENLEWCSNLENAGHAHRTGLFDGAIGSNHYKTKLSDKDILDIRKEYMKGDVTLKYLGKKYKVAFSTIGRIISKATWKHI